MGQMEDLRLFVLVTEAGSISKAADKLGIAKSAVSRRLGLLEDRFATRLIDREPGTWEITAAGRELHQRALRLLSEADEIEADFIHDRQSAVGPLSVSVPLEFGTIFLQPVLLRFAERHPQIQLRVDFDDRRIDLLQENYDLAIRISAQPHHGQTTVSLGRTRHQLYASPDYAKANGLPETLSSLNDHPLLHYGSARRAKWEFVAKKGVQAIDFQPALNSNSGKFLLEATRKGFGIARLPDFVASQACAAGELRTVLPECKLPEWSINLIHSEIRLVNRRMRLFIDEISSACLELGHASSKTGR